MLNKNIIAAGLALALASGFAQARDLKSIGITVGSLGNPFFVTIAKGAEAKAVRASWPPRANRMSHCRRCLRSRFCRPWSISTASGS